MKSPIAVATLALLAGCAGVAGGVRRAPLSEAEGEIQVYLDPLPAAAGRLAVQVESVAAVAAGEAAAPLELLLPELRFDPAAGQRILAVGRLAPGTYQALLVKFRRATLAAEPRPIDLALPDEPTRVPVALSVERRRATVVVLELEYPRSVERGFAFTPSFAAAVPGPAVAQVGGYCTSAAWDQVTVFDKSARRVKGVIPVGREPHGIVLDPRQPRAYVALSGDDRLDVLDVDAGAVVGRIPLRPGDQPREVGITPDGRLLVAVNPGSNTVSFLDPSSAAELGRVDTGEEPGGLLVEPGGRRAYVLNRRSGSITVLDLANRAVAATLRTDAEPLRARTDRTGNRLYVIHAGSAYLAVFSLPDLQALRRIYVGLGASALAVSFRNDLVYVGHGDGKRLQIFDPLSLFPLSSLEVGAPPGYLVLDEVQNVAFALEPSRRTVEAVDLLSGRSLAAMEVGDDPFQVALAGEPR